MATKIRIRGVLYTKTTDAKGREVYDPPLPETTQRMFSRNSESFEEGLEEGVCARGFKNDTDFHRGRMTIRDQFQGDEAWLRRFDKEYRKQTGMSLPKDGVWLGQLADSLFDAKAVIRPGEGQAEVNKLIKRMQRKQQAMIDAPPVRLAEDLVQEKMKKYRETGEAGNMSNADLREHVIEKHGQRI